MRLALRLAIEAGLNLMVIAQFEAAPVLQQDSATQRPRYPKPKVTSCLWQERRPGSGLSAHSGFGPF